MTSSTTKGKIKSMKKYFLLKSEKQLRCGNGDGTFTHSSYCNCKEIDRELNELERTKQ